MAKFEFKIISPYVGADEIEEVEINDEALKGKTEAQQEEVIEEALHDWILDTVERSWKRL